MTRIVKNVGRFEVEMWTDGWPHRISVKDGESGADLRLLTPEDALDLRYALDRVLAQALPLNGKE